MLARSREARKTVRRFARRAAMLTFDGQRPPVECVIWDISQGGARLAVALPLADLPHHFTLNLFKDGSVQRKCNVVWTDKRFVGVKFTSYFP
jgi:PilZ domain